MEECGREFAEGGVVTSNIVMRSRKRYINPTFEKQFSPKISDVFKMRQEGEVAQIWCTPAKCQNKFGGYRHSAEKHLFSSMKEYYNNRGKLFEYKRKIIFGAPDPI